MSHIKIKDLEFCHQQLSRQSAIKGGSANSVSASTSVGIGVNTHTNIYVAVSNNSAYYSVGYSSSGAVGYGVGYSLSLGDYTSAYAYAGGIAY